tara:strand:+ start:1453 stop:1980 length:528 start_codon:yes stop_codon:yes gene_type:complete
MAVGGDIFIGIGANLPAVGYQDAYRTCLAAIQIITQKSHLRLINCSPWYATAPVPAADQPWFVNAVLSVATELTPAALLQELHAVEDLFGRRRQKRNEARVLDLDLLDFRGVLSDCKNAAAAHPILPHPRLHERAFVLYPLRDLSPHWQHPRSGRAIAALIADLSSDQLITAYQP